MFTALLVCAAAVLAAATPGVALAVRDLSAAQDRVTAATLATRAAVLAHDLADERDDLAATSAASASAATSAASASASASASAPTSAAPHSGTGGARLPETDRARTDRQLVDVAPGAPAELRAALATLPAVRQQALTGAFTGAGTGTGTGGPQAVVAAYQPLIDALGRVTGPVTAPLGRAVGAAAVQRALLVGALTGSGGGRELVAAAQVARLQEQAALAEFRATAPAGLRERYDRTVTGADAAQADRDLAHLLDQSRLTAADRALGADGVRSALTARIGLMRSVETSAAADEARAAGDHRDHQVTVLELRVALAALCLLLAAAVLVTVFRGLTRPLAALHRWSRSDAESGQGARVIGADEFAAVARRVNALTHEAQALRSRVRELTAERTTTLGAQSALAAEREALLRTRDDLLRSREALARQLADATARNAVHLTSVHLGLRTLGLVERQLALIEGMEDHEQDPDRLEALFKLDHLATRMRRNSENLLVLTGTEPSPAFVGGIPGHGAAARPVPLIDVARAAISEIERYQRVRVQAVPEARVAGRAADDVSHLIAELLDNATAFSAPTAEVQVSGWPLESGEVMLSVEDSGIGVPPDRLDELNALLADPDPTPPGAVSGMGLYVVARLAHRHGVRVQVRPRKGGGTAAVVVLPEPLLCTVGPDEPLTTAVDAALARETAHQHPPQDPYPQPQPQPEPMFPAPGPAWDAPEPATVPAPTPPAPADTPHVPVPAPTPPAPAATPHEPAPAPHVPAQPPAPDADARPAPETGTRTAKGLPQRIPRAAGLSGEPAVREQPPCGTAVDAEELRRKLGGLQRGLRAGRLDAEQETQRIQRFQETEQIYQPHETQRIQQVQETQRIRRPKETEQIHQPQPQGKWHPRHTQQTQHTQGDTGDPATETVEEATR